ncbi:hypothetical protein NX059_007118 [Plenodomus lindquistii]|nr:hypothetical protein NX059_007118 [Plenodomus lindquistii]
MATNELPIPRDPTKAEAIALFKAVEEKFPSGTLGDDNWYIVTLAALTGGSQTPHAQTLYTYLLTRPEYTTPSQRQSLMRRLREVLFKLVVIVGVCKPLDAIFEIEHVVREEDRDYSFSRENWTNDAANEARGKAWMDKLYAHNMDGINTALASQKDFAFQSLHLTYGLYLSDHTLLSPLSTELAVLSGIAVQNLPRETAWHLRGTRRLGVGAGDVEAVQCCVSL